MVKQHSRSRSRSCSLRRPLPTAVKPTDRSSNAAGSKTTKRTRRAALLMVVVVVVAAAASTLATRRS